MKRNVYGKHGLAALLLSLVLLLGAVPALAGTYSFVGDLCGFSESSPLSYNGTEFYYTANQQLYINGVYAGEYEKFERDEDNDPWSPTEGTGSNLTTTGLSGSWTTDADIMYFIVKGGSCTSPNGYVELYAWESGDMRSGDFSVISGSAGVSHVSLYNAVPIPGALWLLGSGIGALVIGRRRTRRS
ncbi:MAG TPA: hypothetical protein ENN66_01330 [Proteobacteria bacterium]|nr:hypothetical protein [Pseudomonadota bacterium]